MPRVKFDYIVSFSSEDPDNPASNLLSWEVNKKKWLCGAGETSGSVVVQFDKAVKIETVQLGAHHAAFVELLVGRSETPDQPYQVLVSSSVFLPPAESRRAAPAAVERVRSFTASAGDAAVWAQRWDRLRIVCSQPYNKHCKFGLSFVHVFTGESPVGAAMTSSAGIPSRVSALDTLSSSDEEFRPGELFRQHHSANYTNTNTDTGAQIRRATSEAIKNASNTSSRLVKTPLSKGEKQRKHDETSNKNRKLDESSDKRKTKTDHSNISDDSIKTRNERHTDRRTSVDTSTDPQTLLGTKSKRDETTADNSNASTRTIVDDRQHTQTPSNKRKRDEQSDTRTDRQTVVDESQDTRPSNKRRRDDARRGSQSQSTSKQTKCKDPSRILSGVVCVLSGYVHPERGRIRRTAAALGALVRPDWGPGCTHLICAFPNTPKLRAVRALPGGGAVPAVTGEWVCACARAARRLPEPRFATERHRRTASASEESPVSDDEIDFVPERKSPSPETLLRDGSPSPDRSPPRGSESPPPAPPAPDPDRSANSDVEFLVDERIQGKVVVDDSGSEEYDRSTDEEGGGGGEGETDGGAVVAGALPRLLEGARVGGAAPALLQRYVRAYGGTAAVEMELAEGETGGEGGGGDTVHVVCGGGGGGAGGRRVTPDWVWECHRLQRRVDPTPYLVPHDSS